MAKDYLILELNGSGDLSLTKWALRKQSALFQDVFHMYVQVNS